MVGDRLMIGDRLMMGDRLLVEPLEDHDFPERTMISRRATVFRD